MLCIGRHFVCLATFFVKRIVLKNTGEKKLKKEFTIAGAEDCPEDLY